MTRTSILKWLIEFVQRRRRLHEPVPGKRRSQPHRDRKNESYAHIRQRQYFDQM